jgi:hypothetical protein
MMALLIWTVVFVGMFMFYALIDIKTELKKMNALKEKELKNK